MTTNLMLPKQLLTILVLALAFTLVPAQAVGPATNYTFTGPLGGSLTTPSRDFTVTPDGAYTGNINITISGGGLSELRELTFSSSAVAQTFTITPTAVGPVVLTPTSGLTNPPALTYATPPSAPTIGTVTGVNGSASVPFTPPVSTGGSAITNYRADCFYNISNNLTGTGSTSPITVTGLTNGTSYQCTVTATNGAGVSGFQWSNWFTPIALTTTFTVAGPSGGALNTASTAFTVTPNGLYTGAIIITPLGGGLSTPLTLNFSNSDTAQTFIITPTAVGPVSLTSTNNGLLDNPAVLTYGTPSAAPTIGTATAGNGSASVTFTAPGSTGGSTITNYTATCGGITGTGASPIAVTGLTNGSSYNCSVTATNAYGTSAASSASSSVTPLGAPGAPAIGTATAASASATVTFTAPSSTGGSPITGYTVTSNPDNLIASGLALSLTVTGLTNGTTYTFTVTATNSVGTSAASSASSSVTPIGAPGAPAIGTATAANASATVTFTAPSSTGGSPITGYTVTSNPDSLIASGLALSLTVTGLTNGTAYTFTVTATNSAGTSAASSASNSVTPVTPATTFTVSGPSGGALNTASMAFTVTPNAAYAGTIVVTPSGGGLTSPITLSFSNSDAAQTFTITPVAVGPVTLRPKNSATLTNPTALTYATPSEAPAIGAATAGIGSATVAFTAPLLNGGSIVSGYTVDCGGHTATGTSSPLTVAGLTNGTPYTCTVTATNGIGTSDLSQASNQVTAVAPANSFALTGPGGGTLGTLSTAFSVTPNSLYTGGITITPSGGGLSTPITLTFSTSSTPQTFTLTPTVVGPVTLTPTNDGSLVNPAALTYATPSEAPAIGAATAGIGSATVAFTAPVLNGGSIVSGYTVDCGSQTATGTSSPLTVAGLTNGTPYTCTVTATNGVGTSVPSQASNQVTAMAPANSFAVTGPGGGTLGALSTAFSVTPNSLYTGGITITPSGGGLSAPITLTFSNSSTPRTFTLTPTVVGPVTLTPTNDGSLANPAPLTYATPSETPAIGVATAGIGSATVAFTAPVLNGGSIVSGYTVDCGGHSATGTSSPITVAGLTNGTPSTCTVTATNGVGTSASSAASNSVIPGSVPGAPTIGIAIAGNASATVTFAAPASNGGATIIRYTVRSNPGGLTATGSSSPISIGGLTNGTAFTFTVTATNSVGTGAASAACNSITPASVPGAPAIGNATAGNANATVSFIAPASNGARIASFTVKSNPGNLTASGWASPITIGGLTNGTAFTFTVTATNSAGTGAPSAASNQVIPADVLGAPRSVSAIAGNAQATVSFSPPASNAGTPITSYTVTANPGGRTASGSSSPLTVTGLTNGVSYTFTVTATNSAGTGPAPASSNSVTPCTVPGAPQNVAAIAGSAQATLTFDSPTTNGGSAISGYTVTSNPGGLTASGSGSPLTVAHLTNGTAYTFTILAANPAGAGPASSPSNSVTPQTAVPGTPQAVHATAGNGQAIITFVAPAGSGSSAITNYSVKSSPGGRTASGPTGPLTVTGLSNGTAYSFTVAATNTEGTGQASAVSNSVIPAAPLAIDTQASSPVGMVGLDYPLQVLIASGGVAPYRFAVTNGKLPDGLTLASPQFNGIPTSAGDFSFTIAVTDASGNSASSSRSIRINPAHSGLILSQSAVPFSLMVGTNKVPSPARVTVRSSVVQQLLNYSVAVPPNVSWLQVTGGGTTPGSIGIALAPSAVSLGAAETPYQTTIQVACVAPSSCAGDVQNINVSLNVSAPAPRLSVTSRLLSFEALSLNPAPISWPLGIQNAGGGMLTIESATAADNWVSVSGVPATLPAGPAVPVTVTVNPAGLSAGYHLSTITIMSGAGPVNVPVSLLLSGSMTMTLGPAGTQFQSTAGSAPGNTSGSFRVTASGNAPASWSASVLPDSPWLSVDTPSGTASSITPGSVSFSINPRLSAGLAPKTYYGVIRVISNDVRNSPLDFGVILNVVPTTTLVRPDPSPAGLVFVTTSSAGSSAAQNVQVYASSNSAVSYQASAATDNHIAWLSVTPSTGSASSSAPGPSSVSVNTSGLVPGVYTGGVSYAFSSAAVRTVNVTLVVVPAPVTKASSQLAIMAAQSECVSTRLVPTQIGLVDNYELRAGWPTAVSVILLDDCGAVVTSAQVVASFSNGDPLLTLTRVDNTSGVFSGTWTPRSVSPQAAVIVNATEPGSITASTQITGQVAGGTAPLLASNGTMHAFNHQVGAALAPGTIVEIYGLNLSAETSQPTSDALTTTLGGSSVLIGGIAAPLFSVAPGQIDAQIPFELTPGNQYQVQVNNGGALSTPDSIQLAPVSPGIAALESGQVIAQRYPDYSLVGEDAPARPGDRLIIYLTGLGATDRPVATGAPSPAGVLVHPLNAPALTLDGNSVPIEFAGLTPGMVGLYQINFQVPASTPSGNLKLVVSQAGSDSNATTLPVKQ